MLAGIVAFQELPVSTLPEVDYPTIQVMTFYPGASPDVMASAVTAPLEQQFGQIPGLNQMTSSSSFGCSVITLQFVLSLNIDVAEQEVQAAINAASTYLPARPAQSTDLQQGQSGRRADSDARAHFVFSAAVTGRRSCRYPPRSEDLAGRRRRPSEYRRRTKARRTRSGQSYRAFLIWNRAGANTHRDRRPPMWTRPKAISTDRICHIRSATTISYSPADDYKPLIIAYKNGAPVRLSDVANIIDGVGKRQAGRLDEYGSGGDSEYSAAARRQYHCRRRSRQNDPAATSIPVAGAVSKSSC